MTNGIVVGSGFAVFTVFAGWYLLGLCRGKAWAIRHPKLRYRNAQDAKIGRWVLGVTYLFMILVGVLGMLMSVLG